MFHPLKMKLGEIVAISKFGDENSFFLIRTKTEILTFYRD